MQPRSKRIFTVSASLAIVLALVITYFYFGKKARSSQAAPAAPQTHAPGSEEKGSSSIALPSLPNPMAAAFDTGGLPKPLPGPAGDPDQAAAVLAKQVASRDERSTSALLTALQLAGFSIRGADRKIELTPTGPSQGIALEAWQVAAMAKLYGNGAEITLADLGAIFGKLFPGTEKLPFTDLLVASIRNAAAARKPSRFLARFIAELGKNSSRPYDLLNQKPDASQAPIDAVQLSLIMVRLGADLGTLEIKAPARAKPAAWEYEESIESAPQFRPAVFHPGEARLLRIDEEGDGGVPCKLEEWQLTWLDATAIADAMLFDRLLEGLKNFEVVEKYIPMRKYANVVLVLAKAIWTYAALNIDVTMENSPLVRTQDAEKGETRVLKAHITYNIDQWQILNCVRPFLGTLTGLDFGNLPTHGDAGGAGVEWILLQGGVDLGTGIHRITTAQLDQFLAAAHSAIVFFDNGSGSEGETWSTVADENGIATMKVTGTPQAQDISKNHLVPMYRTMSVQVNIQVKVADKGSKLLGEFLDVLGPALAISGINTGGENADPLSGLVAAVIEVLYRMHWYGSQAFDFPVQDWTIADGSWHGMIHGVWTHIDDSPARITVDSVGRTAEKESIHQSSEGTVFVNGGSKTGDLQGTLNVIAKSVATEDGSFQQNGACGPGGVPRFTEHMETKKELSTSVPVTGHVALNDIASVSAMFDESSKDAQLSDSVKQYLKQQMMQTNMNQDTHYEISIVGQIPRGTFTQAGYRRASGYCDGYHPSWTVNRSGIDDMEPPPTYVEGTFDPKNPNVLRGSKDLDDQAAKTHIHLEWDLQR